MSPTPESIRERFRVYLGEERYRNFVYRVPGSSEGSRLLFWQEREWERFVRLNPKYELDFAGIINVFSNCPEYGAKIRRTNYYQLVATWLRGSPMSIIELEERYCSDQSKDGLKVDFFEMGSKQWQEIKRNMEPGDLLFKFNSPPESWANMAGRAGIAVVRDGKVVGVLITSMN